MAVGTERTVNSQEQRLDLTDLGVWVPENLERIAQACRLDPTDPNLPSVFEQFAQSVLAKTRFTQFLDSLFGTYALNKGIRRDSTLQSAGFQS